MKTIAIMNNKGGVGKTVTAINLADILIQDYRKRVLLADCDGQMNLTRFFLPEYDPEVGYSMVSLLLGDGEPVWSDNVVPLRPGLNLVPGSLELYSLDLAAMSEYSPSCSFSCNFRISRIFSPIVYPGSNTPLLL